MKGAAGRVFDGLSSFGSQGFELLGSLSSFLLTTAMVVLQLSRSRWPAARSWVFATDRMVLALVLVWLVGLWLGRWVVLGSGVSMWFSDKRMVGLGFGQVGRWWFAGLVSWRWVLIGYDWVASSTALLQQNGIVSGFGWRFGGGWSLFKCLHRNWRWLGSPRSPSPLFELAFWGRNAGCSSSFCFLRVFVFGVWLGLISPYSIELGFGSFVVPNYFSWGLII